MSEAAGQPAETLRFDGRAEYQAAVDELLACAARTLDIFDSDLVDTGLSQSQRVARLSDALLRDPAMTVRIILHDASELQYRMPRLWNLCSAHSHRIEIRQTPGKLRHFSDAFMLSGSGHTLVRTHSNYWRGKLMRGECVESSGYRARFNELWEMCPCCISTTKLGL